MTSRFGFVLAVLATISMWPARAFAAAPVAQPTELKKGMAKCAELEGELVRLACFDKLADQNGLKRKAVAKAVPGAGRWSVVEDKNPIDDSRDVIASLESESGKSRWGQNIRLILRCRSKALEAFIDWSSYLGLDHAEVITRVDSAEAKTLTWNVSTNNQASFMRVGDLSEFLRALESGKRLVAQVTPYSENPITAIFDLKGIPVVVDRLKAECGWPKEPEPEPEPVVVPGAP